MRFREHEGRWVERKLSMENRKCREGNSGRQRGLRRAFQLHLRGSNREPLAGQKVVEGKVVETCAQL